MFIRRYGRTVVAFYVYDGTGYLEGAQSRPEEFIEVKKYGRKKKAK